MLCSMNFIFMLLCLTFTIRSDTDTQGDLPDLEDIVPSLQRKDVLYDNMTSDFNTIDLEKLNLPKIKEKVDSLRHDFKNMKPSRRQASVGVGKGSFISVYDQRTRRKVCDVMLQTIYMARHKLKQMARSKYFKVTDTGYRIAYLYKNLSATLKKIVTIYWTMMNHTEEWLDIRPYLILHHKAMRFHIDFNNIWWVMVRVDGIFKDRQARDNTMFKS